MNACPSAAGNWLLGTCSWLLSCGLATSALALSSTDPEAPAAAPGTGAAAGDDREAAATVDASESPGDLGSDISSGRLALRLDSSFGASVERRRPHLDTISRGATANPMANRLNFAVGPQEPWLGHEGLRPADEIDGQHFFGRRAYAVIGYASYRDSHGWAIGPEAWLNGNPRYRIKGLGVAVRNVRAGPLLIDLRLGATGQPNRGQAIRGGAEFRWHRP